MRSALIVLLALSIGWTAHAIVSIPDDVLGAEQPLHAGDAPEKASPGDWVQESQIRVYEDSIVIEIPNAKWSTFLDTNSMDPVIDAGSNGLQVVPQSPEQLRIGDIVSYDNGQAIVVHRIVSIGNDAFGWYALVKGDNNPMPDTVKVRFTDIKRVLIGIIY